MVNIEKFKFKNRSITQRRQIEDYLFMRCKMMNNCSRITRLNNKHLKNDTGKIFINTKNSSAKRFIAVLWYGVFF